VADKGGQSERSRLPWGRGIASALGNTTNLVVAGVAGMGAAALHSLPVLALGSTAYLALVAWDLVSPEHWRKAIKSQRPEVKMPDPDKLTTPEVKAAARSLIHAKTELARVVAESPPQIARYLDMALSNVDQIESAAVRLVARAEDIERYLSGATQEQALLGEIEAIDNRLKKTLDGEARAQFQSAREAKVGQVRTLRELIDARDRVVATLTRLVTTYEALPNRVVHMRALDAAAMDTLSGDVNRDLDQMNNEVVAFEDTLKDSVRPANKVHA
jgi:hypothetical protein